MKSTLTIEDVDFGLLNEQQQDLAGLLNLLRLGLEPIENGLESLEGVVNMLGAWSDDLFKRGLLGVPHPGDLYHVDNMETVDMLERQGFTGTDASLTISLFEYGFAWRKLPQEGRTEEQDDWMIIYASNRKEGNSTFDATPYPDEFKKTDFNFVDWDGLFSFLGTCEEEWDSQITPMKLYRLSLYHGKENVFGSPARPFEIRDPEKYYGSTPAPGESPEDYFHRLLYGEVDGSGESVIAKDFVRSKSGVYFVRGGGGETCFGGHLCQWHNGTDAIYAAGSSTIAGKEVPLDVLSDAIDLMESNVSKDREVSSNNDEWEFSRQHGLALLNVMKAALNAAPSEEPQSLDY